VNVGEITARAALAEARRGEMALANVVSQLQRELSDARKQIRADHAYTASVAGSPCTCGWCSK
jgi:hypothetical protein